MKSVDTVMANRKEMTKEIFCEKLRKDKKLSA
jgi:hypothetical protein